jgi:RNA polymerase sigma factor (sigma-70 family)
MTSELTNSVMRQVCRIALLSDDGELTDGQLLQRFLDQRDEAAFELLLRRHGPLILSVCRRMLGNDADADDAFQAVFVVLVRKAAAFRTRRTIGDWLYGVAYHTALKARAASVKRRFKESQARPLVPPDPTDDLADALPLLDQELSRLPAKYREPVVLCELQGHSRKETARQLGIPEGTLSSRLAMARKLLAKRLARYGLEITGGTMAGLLASKMATASVPPALAASTLEAATAGATAPVAALAEGVLKAMLMTKLKMLAVVVLVFGVVAGAALWLHVLRHKAAARFEAEAYAEQARADAIAESDEDYIQGTWTLVRIDQPPRKPAEEPSPLVTRGQAKVVFTDNQVRLWDGSEARYALDAGKHPKQFRLTQGEGVLTATLIGIYELKGDNLKICFNLSHSDNKPPSSFDIKSAKPPALVPVVYVLKRDPVKDTPKKDEPKKADADKTPAVQVRFVGPAGAKLKRFGVEDIVLHEIPCRLTFEKPGTYRLKLMNIPNHPGLELYPTLEVYAATKETTTFLTHSAIPVEFTDTEIDKAVKGKMATCAVCLHQDGDQTFSVTEPPTNDDVVGLAKKKGPILLVVRLGSIDLEAKKDIDDGYRAAMIAALHHFAGQGELDHVKAVLAKHPDLVDAKRIFRQPHKPDAGDDFTPLFAAVLERQDNVAAYLLSKGANVNAVDGNDWTPLHRAATQGDLAMVRLLVKHGAKIDAKGAGGTPLDLAVDNKRTEVVEYLKSLRK